MSSRNVPLTISTPSCPDTLIYSRRSRYCLRTRYMRSSKCSIVTISGLPTRKALRRFSSWSRCPGGHLAAIDPHVTAQYLGLGAVFANSIDAVSDRDFVAEFIFACSMSAVHLSQLAETLIIWNSREFGFISFGDAVTTASSLMPQKKNPDPVELVRGKAGSLFGELINLLTTLKALPLGYNRDLQETKPPAIHAAKVLSGSLAVMAVAIDNLTVNKTRTLQAACDPDMITTDLVEYLVNQGVHSARRTSMCRLWSLTRAPKVLRSPSCRWQNFRISTSNSRVRFSFCSIPYAPSMPNPRTAARLPSSSRQ